MRHTSYAAAAASAVGSSSSDSMQQPSTGTSPSICSSGSPRYEREDRKEHSAASSPSYHVTAAAPPPAAAAPSAAPAAAATAAPPAARALSTASLGVNPGRVKLLKEQFERQSSDGSVSFVPRVRVPAAQFTGPTDGRGTAEDPRHLDMLTDAHACAEMIRQLLQEKEELQQQVDSLWNQKEAFRCANERISRVLLRQHQELVPQAALFAAAEAAGATPRNDGARRSVNVVPSGCLTARGPRGPRISNGVLQDPQEIPRLDLSSMNQMQQQQQQRQPQQHMLQHPKQRQLQQSEKRKAVSIPGMTPLNLKALERKSGGAVRSSGVSFRGGSAQETRGSLCLGGSLTCRASLASSALKTPRRRFGDGGISARASGRATVRLGSREVQLEHQQHAAIEQALVASMRSMNLLNHLGSGSSSSSNRKLVKANGPNVAGDSSRAEFTPETALLRCSSNPDRGYWHTTFVCVLKVEGTDFFLDVEPLQHQPVPKAAQRAGSSFFSSSSETPSLSGARIVASKDTAGVFHVCVRRLLREDNWFRSIVTSMYWGLASGVDPSRLPPDQTLEHGLSLDETQAGASGTSRLSSTPTPPDSGREEDEAAAADSNSLFSGWDAVAFMYQRSIDALGNSVPGKSASPSEGLYISTRTPEGTGPSLFSSRSLSLSSNRSKSSSSSSIGSIEESRRAEHYLASKLILQTGQATEQLFIVRAKDRLTGLMPLYHQATQRYVYVHPSLGVVGLVPPLTEQERRTRSQQKGEQQRTKKLRRRWRAKKHEENGQQPQKQEGSSSRGSSPQSANNSSPPDTLLRPCRIELIPLADLLLQQSVQRVLSTVQEAALQQQQLIQRELEEQQTSMEEAARETARSVGSSSEFSSNEEDSFDGPVASEGGEEVDPSKGNTSRRRKPLVPPLGSSSAAVATLPEVSSVSQMPGPVEFKLDDDEGVETDVEEGVVRLRGNGSGSGSGNMNVGSNFESYYWPTSVEPTKQQ